MKNKTLIIAIALFAVFSNGFVSAHANEVPVINDAGPLAAIELKGPGSRIHGADISRWQHPNGKLINFKKMREAGLNFLIIKGLDTRIEPDALSRNWPSLLPGPVFPVHKMPSFPPGYVRACGRCANERRTAAWRSCGLLCSRSGRPGRRQWS